jgi:choline dehydrogenase-like flavoprotein
MRSGYGPREHLEAHGIEVIHDNPMVGSTLEDRREVGMNFKMAREWAVLKGARYAAGDPQYMEWQEGQGVYTSSGASLGLKMKTRAGLKSPDLFAFMLLSQFGGYKPGYSEETKLRDRMTWALLLAHPENNSGTVRLRSADPRKRPVINFNYDNDTERDIESVVFGLKFIRKMTEPLIGKGIIESALAPGPLCVSDAQLADYVRDVDWGHHASCTCPMGNVLDGDFQVRDTKNLRVVSLASFPRTPGLFPMFPLLVAARKAADVIVRKYNSASTSTLPSEQLGL